MGQILILHLVNDLGSDSISGSQSDTPSMWPGVETPYNFTPAPQAIRPVMIGVSLDGNSNQVYPLGTSVPDIRDDGWARVYQGTEIVGVHGDVLVFSDQYPQLQFMLEACCGSDVVTAAYNLKQSNYSLAPDAPNPPCGAEAIFKQLVVRSKNDARALLYIFQWALNTANGDEDLQFFGPTVQLPLDGTTQQVMSWPSDFIGEVSATDQELVANNVSPGEDQVQVRVYDLGTIQLLTSIVDNTDPENPVLVQQVDTTFRLPGTDCEADESSSGSSSGSESEGPPPVGFVPNMRMMAEITAPGQLRVFDFDVSHDTTGWVNWGDGSPDVPLDSAGSGEVTTSHAYAGIGNYVVQLRLDDPTALADIQTAGGDTVQLNAYEFLVPFPNCTSVNMTQAVNMNAFSMINLPAVTDLAFDSCNFTQAGLDQMIQELDENAPDNGVLSIITQQTGAIPNEAAGPYTDLVTFRGWIINHD